MEHILISPRKLKLMLTKSDLDRYELDDITHYGEDDFTRMAFRELLADVKRSVGFDASEDKVLIQLYPSRDGGAEVYITRLGIRREESENTGEQVTVESVYGFASMEELLLGCSRLVKASPPKKSSVWQGDSTYYLLTEGKISYRDSFKSKNGRISDNISECCKEYHSDIATAYVKEHCRCLCDEDAVKLFAELL